MASMASIGSLKVPSSPSTATKSSSSSNHSRGSVVKRLAFSSSQLSGDKIVSKAVTGDRRRERRPIVVSPQAVSDSKNSQTCLDPEASRVSFFLLHSRKKKVLFFFLNEYKIELA